MTAAVAVVSATVAVFGQSHWAAAAAHAGPRALAAGFRGHRASGGCHQDVVFIGARGTGEGDSGFGPTVSAVYAQVDNRFHGTGRLLSESLDRSYPALNLIDLFNGHPKRYLAGVSAGRKAVVNAVVAQIERFRRERCANPLHVMLAGYSAGAWAVGDAYLRLKDAQRRVIVGVVLLGDPRNHGNLYWHGIYDAGHPWAEGDHGGVWSSCLFADPICHADAATTGARGVLCLISKRVCAHFGYTKPQGPADEAGLWLAGRVRSKPRRTAATVIGASGIGPLQIGTATQAQVRAFAGNPNHVWSDGDRSAPVNFSGTLWGYRCPGSFHGLPCMTKYGFTGAALSSFSTQSTAFRTAHGVKVGTPLQDIHNKEKGSFGGFRVQCPGFVFATPPAVTFVAQVDSATRLVYGFYLSLSGLAGSFGECGS